jgi:O-antigen/teichoic acid export membrane protein
MLSREGYGIYIFAFSVMSLLAIPVHLGMPLLVMRQVAQYDYQEKWGLLRGVLLRTNQLLILLATAGAIIAAVAGAYLFNDIDPIQYATLGWALLLLPLLGLNKLRASALNGLRHAVLGQLPELLLLPVIVLVLLTIAQSVGGDVRPVEAMALYCVAAASTFLVGALMLRRAMPRPLRDAKPQYDTSRWLRSVLPLSLLGGVQAIHSQTDLFLLGVLATKEEVALYRVALSGAALIIFAQTAADVVMAPYITRMYAAGTMSRLQRMVTQVARLVLLVGLPIALVFVLWGDTLLDWVYGAEYRSAYAALVILCAAQLFSIASGSVHLLLNMTSLERLTVRGVASAALINVILNFILIPVWGLEGAAVATATSIVALNALLHWALWKKIGIWGSVLTFRRFRHG